jgi:hypothetical protein
MTVQPEVKLKTSNALRYWINSLPIALFPSFLIFIWLRPCVLFDAAWAFPRLVLIGILIYLVPFAYILIRTRSIVGLARRCEPKSPKPLAVLAFIIFGGGPMWGAAFALMTQIGIRAVPSAPLSVDGKVSSLSRSKKFGLKVDFDTSYGIISAKSPTERGYQPGLAQRIPMPEDLKEGDAVRLDGLSNRFAFVLYEVKAGEVGRENKPTAK